MATTRTKRVTTVAKESVESKEAAVQAEKIDVQKREFAPDEGIPCVSITTGELIVIGEKSGISYDWLGRGDVVDVEYQDLVAAIRMGKACIKEPYFIIQSDEFLARYPQVKEIYGGMYTFGDLRKVITDLDVQSMKLTIESLPSGAKDSIRSIASTMIQNGQLDSVSKIKMLDEIYGTDFMLLSGLYSE